MRAPAPPVTPKAREAAAVEHVVDLIRSQAETGGDEYGDTFATALAVRSTVDFLQEIFATYDDKSPWGIKLENRNAIAKINKHVQILRESLDGLPVLVRYLLLSAERLDALDLDALGLGTLVKGYKQAADRFHRVTALLQALQNRCDELIGDPPGERPNTDYRQKLVAIFAADLLDNNGLRPTRGNDAKPSLFEQIAPSLFEAATGEAGANLAHACREVLETWESKGHFISNFNESGGMN